MCLHLQYNENGERERVDNKEVRLTEHQPLWMFYPRDWVSVIVDYKP